MSLLDGFARCHIPEIEGIVYFEMTTSGLVGKRIRFYGSSLCHKVVCYIVRRVLSDSMLLNP